jgi:cation diffusion facilitator CzcD-associated flavoprotein CzcO
MAQLDAQRDSAAAPQNADAAATLDAQTRHVFRWAGRDPADWVRPRAGVDHNVVIVGGGQSGVAIAYGLRRKGVGRVEVIDQAEAGQAGIWRTIARMHQLRTPKNLAGPELGNPALGFRAWYETLNGPDAFDALDRIPRLAWADYLAWFQQTTGTTVRYRTRLLEIEPQGDVLRLHLESEGVRRVETTRKLVLANGYAGAGGPNVPDSRALPTTV